MRKHIRLIWNHRKMQEKTPAKILRCWVAMRKSGCFLRSSDAKCLRFGLPLRFGLRCERPRCQIASDSGRAMRTTKLSVQNEIGTRFKVALSGPLNRLNAILSLLHPLDRYRAASAIGSAIGRPLSRPISHPNTGGSPQPPRSKPLGGLNRAIVAL